MGGPWPRRLRRLAASKVLALALTHALGARGGRVQLGREARAPVVTRVQWRGRWGWLAPTWVFQPETCAALQQGDFRADQWRVTVPWALREDAHARGDDLLFFGAVLAAEAPQQAEAAGKPLTVVHWLPSRWQRGWGARLQLTLKAERAFSVVLHGIGARGEGVQQAVGMMAGEVQRLDLPWQGVYALEASHWPRGRLGLRAAGRGVYVVSPDAWENIHLYGGAVWLLGFTTWRRFWRQARYLRRGARSFPHGVHFAPAYALPWCDLEPLRAL